MEGEREKGRGKKESILKKKRKKKEERKMNAVKLDIIFCTVYFLY